MRVAWLRVDDTPYINVLALEVALRDMADEADHAAEAGFPDPGEAAGLRRVVTILEAITRRDDEVIV